MTRRRVLLTDGGVYDNLGTACMEPGRTEGVSTHVFNPDYIIACDAGVGVIDGTGIPYWWPTRMVASFNAVLRRVQNDTRNRLHAHVASGTIRESYSRISDKLINDFRPRPRTSFRVKL